MTLHPHWGHLEVRRALARARVRDSLPTALLIQGERGVGKQHLALWLARLLLCDKPGPDGPCDTCSQCHLGLRLEHPDLHWHFPLPRPKGASSPQKLARALEDARADALKRFRENPVRAGSVKEPRGFYLAAAQALRREAQKKPSQGDRQVFVLAEAEALAPQDSSSEAANALLKLLEEPPPGTTLILTSGEPGRLLPTIRSRTAQLHLPPLSRDEVRDFLVHVAGVSGDEADRASLLAHGSIGRALGFLPDGDDPGPLEALRREAFRLLSAAVAPSQGLIFEVASQFPPVGARGLSQLLDSLEEWLRDLALAATGGMDEVRNREKKGFFLEVIERTPFPPPAVAAATGEVEKARAMASGNVNPQLIVFGLLLGIRKELIGSGLAPRNGR
ncbi:ATP-binding protein [Gemmatimonadota bacterium]